jgi:hypothetical protein
MLWLPIVGVAGLGVFTVCACMLSSWISQREGK